VSSYRERLAAAGGAGPKLCLGIDPSAEQLALWALEDSALGAEQFALTCITEAAEQIGIVKIQVGFFERFGSAGFKALETALQAAREAGLFVIADAKRGDIGSTMRGYAEAWLSPESPLASEALTISPYLGLDSAIETLEFARSFDRGLFALAATSNPEGQSVQLAKLNGQALAERVVRRAAELAAGHEDLGVVIGATQNLADYGLSWIVEQDCSVPILAPGYGAQGASLTDVKRFGASSHRVIATVSRAITGAGPQGVAAQLESARALL
jgi:orotidine-5'-phosphate decarboxylase